MKNEGVYEIKLSLVQLVDCAENDSTIFSSDPLGKLEISGELTGFLLKQAVCSMYNANLKQDQPELTLEGFNLRNP